MGEKDVQTGIDRIWLRYTNLMFIYLVALCLAGLAFIVMRPVPFVGLLMLLAAFLLAYYFWWHYFSTACPQCGQQFAGIMHKHILGLSRPDRCQHCGLSAKRENH